PGKRLSIAAGQVLKTGIGDPLIVVQGTLLGNGTASAPIIFTSARDDTAGGDTNNNGPTTGANGDWNRIEFKDGSTGNVLDHVEIRYGGGYGGSAEIAIGNAGVTISNGVIRNSYTHGVRIQGGKPVLSQEVYQDNNGSAVSMDLSSSPAIR